MRQTPYRKFYPWFIWLLAATFFFVEYLARIAPSIMVDDLMRVFSVDALALGSLSAFFYYAYVGMQVPVGTLVDRYGPRKLLAVMAAIAATSCFLFSVSQDIWTANFARFLMGFGSAFAFVGALKIASVWFPKRQFGLLAGLTQATGMLGAAFGEGPMSVFVAHFGWRKELWLIGVIFLILAILIGIFVQDNPPEIQNDGSQVIMKYKVNIFQALKIVFRNKQSWINSAYAGLIYSPTAAFAELWGVSYLSHVYGMDTEVAASAITMIYVGWALGGPIIGWLSDFFGQRKPLMYVSAVGSLMTMGSVLYAPHLSDWLVFTLLFFYGVFNTGVALSYAVAGENNPHPIAGTSMAFCNMASVIIGAAFQPIIGWFLDLEWTGELIKGVPVYTAQNFRYAMVALPICLFIGVLVVYFIRETYCHSIETDEGFERYHSVVKNA